MTVRITSVLTLIFTVLGPHNFQMDSIISENSKFGGPVDHVKKVGTLPSSLGNNIVVCVSAVSNTVKSQVQFMLIEV